MVDKAAPAEAWQRGLQAARAADLPTAKLWLERAMRLAPNDPRIELDLANLWLAGGTGAGLAKALASFEALARRHDVAIAWQGLIVARRRAGDPAGAAAAAAEYLSRHCVDDDGRALMSAVARDAGLPGWCGCQAAGAILAVAPNGAKIVARLDGAAIAPPQQMRTVAGGKQLELAVRKTPLLGSPLDLVGLRRVEGVVAATESGGLAGWACRPAAPEQRPELSLADSRVAKRRVGFGAVLPPDEDAPFLRRHSFEIQPEKLRELWAPFQIRVADGAVLAGSPTDPAAQAALVPVPPGSERPAVRRLPPRQALAVVVPVYRHFEITSACLAALYRAAPAGSRIVVVDDASPEPALSAWLDGEAAAGRITLLRHERNAGFPGAANTGLAEVAGCDVVLLNSDTLVPPGALQTLVEAGYAAADHGSATPFSNDATILSYPSPEGSPTPDLAGATALNAAAARANGKGTMEVPTAIGFCMFMRHDCIAATGLFRQELFAQGYGEENDWCLRARQLGYRHVAATGAFVAHHGGVSFRAASRALNIRNFAILSRLWPAYHWAVQRFIADDRLAPARRRFDLARFAAGRVKAGAVLLISHNHGGGVARQVAEEMAAIRAGGQRPILLFPAAPPDPERTHFPWPGELTDAAAGDYPNLRFVLRAGLPALLDLLRSEGVRRVVLHHGLGHHPAVRGIAASLGVPQEIVIHDYASFCPRVNLLTRPEPEAALRYCGEPNVAGCIDCVDRNGDETFEGLSVPRLLTRSAAEFAAAARITAPSADAARRIGRHFAGVRPDVTPWEDDAAPMTLTPPRQNGPGGRRRIVVIGGIGPSKGFDLLIDCALDARGRDLPLDYLVAGASAEDGPLLAAGIFVTGAYAEGEAEALVRELDVDLAFLPSIWPETWCFTLAEAWRAGLYTVAFDLGAQAARIRATGRGAVLPLGLPAARINDSLLAWQPDLLHSLATNKTVS